MWASSCFKQKREPGRRTSRGTGSHSLRVRVRLARSRCLAQDSCAMRARGALRTPGGAVAQGLLRQAARGSAVPALVPEGGGPGVVVAKPGAGGRGMCVCVCARARTRTYVCSAWTGLDQKGSGA